MKIQEFSFGNFKSFKEIQTLNLSAAKIKSNKKEIDFNNVIYENSNQFLKTKAIYGANASGKSNIIKALVTFIRIIKTSIKDEDILYLVDSFRLSTETENEPSFFQLIFWHNNVKYRYGFEVDDEKVYAEWLYSTPNKRELPLFIREGKNIIELDKTNYSEGYKLVSLFEEETEENEIFRKNSLFLSTLATFGFGKLSKDLINAIGSTMVISGLGHQGMYKFAGEAITNIEKKKYIVNFLKYGDVGIEDIDAMDVPEIDATENLDETKKESSKEKKKKLLISFRKKYDENQNVVENESFPFSANESEGTQKLFELSPFIYEALKNNRPIIIDEFDARFHPLLTKKIVELFNSSTNSGSQLIFTTHDTNLLSSDLLRRDQIEFVEKDQFGASHLYSLVEFKGIRNNASFEKDYIQGKYGAVPFLGDFDKLINSDLNA